MIEPWVYPIAGGVGALSMFGIKKFQERKEAKANMLPTNGQELCSDELSLPSAQSEGRLTLVVVGTGGLGMAKRTIDEFGKSGRLADIGCLIAIDFDERERNKFLTYIMQNYPMLIRRTVYNEETSIPGGFQGRVWDEVMDKDLKLYWAPQVMDCLSKGASLIRATENRVYSEPVVYQHNYEPAAIVIYASPGSHAPITDICGQFLKSQFPLANIYVVTFVSENTFQKRQFPEVMRHYQESNFAKIFFIGDMVKAGMFFDHSVAAFLSAIWVAPLIADRPDSPWNILSSLNPKGMNGVVVSRVWLRNLPVKMTAGRKRFFCFDEAAVNACIDGLREIENESLKTIDLATPKDETARYVSISLPLKPYFLIRVKDKVEEMERSRNYFQEDPDRHLIWAPTMEYISSSTEQVKMTVVKMETAIQGIDGIPHQVAGMLPPGDAGME